MRKKSLLLLVMLFSGVMLYFSNTEIRAKKISKIKKINKISIKGIKTTMRDRFLKVEEFRGIVEKWGIPEEEYISAVSLRKDVATFVLKKGGSYILTLRYRDGSTRDWFVGERDDEGIGIAYVDNLNNEGYAFGSYYIGLVSKFSDEEHLIFYEFSKDLGLIKTSLGMR